MSNLKINDLTITNELLISPVLSSNEKLIASLATLDKYKYSEIARILGLNPITVYRGMNRLVQHGVLKCLEHKNARYKYKFCDDKHIPGQSEPSVNFSTQITPKPSMEFASKFLSDQRVDPGDIPIFKKEY